jgi:formamidopyrimidine-DNA glycosylase
VIFHLAGGRRVTYNDPRRFGFMDLIPSAALADHPFFRDMGVEPLGNELDGPLLARLFQGRKAPLKAALLDQRLIAGLGNIYVCEALNRARLSPKRAAGTLARRSGAASQAADRLATDIRAVLEDALRAGGSSLRDHKLTDGSLGYFQHLFRVYDREGQPCPTSGCGGTVRRIVQSGRSTFYCPRCQK